MGCVLCYGDSNTWGFDPRDPFGGRYAAGNRWPELLASALPWPVVNCGQNGREVPHSVFEVRQLDLLLEQHGPVSLLVLSVGTNDILNTGLAEPAVRRMETLLTYLTDIHRGLPVLLVSPAEIRLEGNGFSRLAGEAAEGYRRLAERFSVRFFDASALRLPLAFDGVHYLPEGHIQFARAIAPALQEILGEVPQK